MTPAARAQAAIDILAALDATSQPVDRYLRDYFNARRYAGSKDRRAIAERVFQVMRHRAGFAHRMGDSSARALVIASLLAEDENPQALFAGGYGPAPLTEIERAAIAATPGEAPPHVTGEYPVFLEPSLLRAFGSDLPAEMEALQTRAPVDLRVNTLKATRRDVLAALGDAGLAAMPTPYAPHGIRIASGTGNALLKSPLFESGLFEFQDEAAQIAAHLCGAGPDMRVLDFTAGAGGKTLALAADMHNRGEIIACDARAAALEELRRRAGRAGVANVRALPAAEGVFDIVLLDAPCSGSGTWRRQPELRWRLTPARLVELMELQDRLLDQAASHTAPGGRLVYATCSLLPEENEDRVGAFLVRNAGFARLEAAAAWQGPDVPGMAADFHASPAKTGTDGFFCALLRHS